MSREIVKCRMLDLLGYRVIVYMGGEFTSTVHGLRHASLRHAGAVQQREGDVKHHWDMGLKPHHAVYHYWMDIGSWRAQSGCGTVTKKRYLTNCKLWGKRIMDLQRNHRDD